MLKLQKKLSMEYNYKSLPKMLSTKYTYMYLTQLPDIFKDNIHGANLYLYSLDDTLIAKRYNRIVIGDYGAFIEISPEDMYLDNLKIKDGEEYRIEDEYFRTHVKYYWLTTKDNSNCKIYYQTQRVSYADYKPQYFYISPYEVYFRRNLDLIYTSYFGNLKRLPKNVIPISICGKAPNWYKGLQYKKLAPKYWFFKEWQQTHNNRFYVTNFNKEVLDTLNPNDVVSELYKLANKNSNQHQHIALICYEKPTDFCHRHIVSKWLRKNGYECKEFDI